MTSYLFTPSRGKRLPLMLVLAAATVLPLAAAAQSPSPGASDSVARHPITMADLDALSGPGGLQLSPDGRYVAFHRLGAVWVMRTELGSEPERLGDGHSPRWAPDGRGLAFFGSAPESGETQIFVARAEVRGSNAGGGAQLLWTDAPRQVTHVEGGISPDRLDWSVTDRLAFTVQVALSGHDEDARDDDGTPEPPHTAVASEGEPLVLDLDTPDGIALDGLLSAVSGSRSQRVETTTEVFVHELATGRTYQLTHDELGYSNASWSPDGNALLVNSREGRGLGAFETALYRIDAASGESTLLVESGNTLKLDAAWSPDGKHVAYAFHSFKDRAEHGAAVVGVDSEGAVQEPHRLLSALVDALVWSADGQRLLTSYSSGIVFKPVFSVDIASGEIAEIGSGDCYTISSSLSVSRSGAVAWVASTGRVPYEIRVAREPGAPALGVYDANPQVRDWDLGAQEVVRWTNAHGHERAGILIKPVGYRPGVRYPLVVSAYTENTHFNGFQLVTAPGFGSQAYASRGFAVFFPGPRVPWTYGALTSSEEEAEEVAGADGWDVTVDDVESGVDELIRRGIVDPSRMAAIGFSNGGAVVSALVAHSGRYKAGVILAPANLNWVQLALFQDNTSGRWVPTATFTGIGKDISEDPAAYLRGSLVFRMASVTTPLLLAVGDVDHPSFSLPTVQVYLALRRAGRDVTLLRYPGMGHGFYGPAKEDLQSRVMFFVERQLNLHPEEVADATGAR